MVTKLKHPEHLETAEEMPEIAQHLVDIGNDLSVGRLLRGYQSGSFPWTANPVTWWSPDPRTVIEFDNFHVSRSLKRTLKKGRFEVTVDKAFPLVIRACAAPARGRRTTWISREFIEAYSELHHRGYAHSLEVWREARLVGGIYGLGLGGYFAGESMFHRVSDASKVALYYLVQHLKTSGYTLFDVQMPTRVTLQLGATLIPRVVFLHRLRHALRLAVSFAAAPRNG